MVAGNPFRIAADGGTLSEAPQPQDDLTAAWAALAERERRTQEVMRRRLADFEERSARLAALNGELDERADRLAAAEAGLDEAQRRLAEREQLLSTASATSRRARRASRRTPSAPPSSTSASSSCRSSRPS